MKKIILGLSLLALPAFAANVPETLQASTPHNIPMVAGAVTNQFVSASTVVTVTVPFAANTFIASGDNMWVCDDPRRCGPSFPASSVSVTGWTFNPSGRILKGNLQVSTSYIYTYARPVDMPSAGQAIHSFEWSKQ